MSVQPRRVTEACLLIAIVLFVIVAFGVSTPVPQSVKLEWVGMAFLAASFLF